MICVADESIMVGRTKGKLISHLPGALLLRSPSSRSFLLNPPSSKPFVSHSSSFRSSLLQPPSHRSSALTLNLSGSFSFTKFPFSTLRFPLFLSGPFSFSQVSPPSPRSPLFFPGLPPSHTFSHARPESWSPKLHKIHVGDDLYFCILLVVDPVALENEGMMYPLPSALSRACTNKRKWQCVQ